MKTKLITLGIIILLFGSGYYANANYGYWRQYKLEKNLLTNLDDEAKKFFKESIKIRSGYFEESEHKFLPGDWSMDSRGYANLTPEGDWIPNPLLYPDTPTIPPVFYRYKKDCATDKTILRMRVDTSRGYSNYTGGNRREQQCVLDGTYDTYYVETLEPIE